MADSHKGTKFTKSEIEGLITRINSECGRRKGATTISTTYSDTIKYDEFETIESKRRDLASRYRYSGCSTVTCGTVRTDGKGTPSSGYTGHNLTTYAPSGETVLARGNVAWSSQYNEVYNDIVALSRMCDCNSYVKTNCTCNTDRCTCETNSSYCTCTGVCDCNIHSGCSSNCPSHSNTRPCHCHQVTSCKCDENECSECAESCSGVGDGCTIQCRTNIGCTSNDCEDGDCDTQGRIPCKSVRHCSCNNNYDCSECYCVGHRPYSCTQTRPCSCYTVSPCGCNSTCGNCNCNEVEPCTCHTDQCTCENDSCRCNWVCTEFIS